MSTNTATDRRVQSRQIRALLMALALLAAACASDSSGPEGDAAPQTATTVGPETAEIDSAAPSDEEADTRQADEEPAAEQEPASEDPGPPGDDAPETVSVTAVGTTIDIDFQLETASVSGTGASVHGRADDFSPFTSFILFFRATGFADATTQGNDTAPQPFTGTLESLLEIPELEINDRLETMISGFDATVIDFTVTPSDTLIADCGPPPTDQCALIASTPDQGDFDAIFARTSHQLRLWHIDQGDELPLVIMSATAQGDADWPLIAEDAITTIALGDPQPAPSE